MILALKEDATSPPSTERMSGCVKGRWPENKVTWQCPAPLSQDTGVLPSTTRNCVYVYVCVFV